MAEAGLTLGAFYRHFSFYAESIITAAYQSVATVEPVCGQTPVLTNLVNKYLSLEHRSGENVRGPLAFLITDITLRDEQVRDTHTRVFKGFISNPQCYSDGEGSEIEKQAMQKGW